MATKTAGIQAVEITGSQLPDRTAWATELPMTTAVTSTAAATSHLLRALIGIPSCKANLS